jgi:uncharacterized membrane protein YfcA
MEILGYIAAIGIGILLGLMGGGGSILTVPVMVYLLAIAPVMATAYSLFVVGISSLAGAMFYMKKKRVSLSTAILFSIPSLIAVYITRRFLVPIIPDPVFENSTIILSKDSFIMILFAVLMISVFIYMIKGKPSSEGTAPIDLKLNYPLITIEALAVGLITGIVGIGGGFLIIPSLVVLVKLPMKRAIGTSLLIIAINSLVGFLGDLHMESIHWKFLFLFTSFSLVGIGIGIWLSKFISGRKLKPIFGWFVLATGIFILINELLIK